MCSGPTTRPRRPRRSRAHGYGEAAERPSETSTTATVALDGLGRGPLILNSHLDGLGRDDAGTSTGLLILSEPRALAAADLLNDTVIGGAGAASRALAEQGSTPDLSTVRNCNLRGKTLLLDEGTTSLSTAAQVNASAGGPIASGNISADPEVDATFHLSATSPNRGAGAFQGSPLIVAPFDDRDREPRPQPAATNPDIGPDERP